MAGSTLFEQALKHISKAKFLAPVHRHQGDKGITSFDCWSRFLALLYGQFSGYDSIRSITHLLAHLEEALFELIKKAKACSAARSQLLIFPDSSHAG